MGDACGLEMGRRPDFLIIGAAKAGTSTLYDYLVSHPGIHMSPIKEPCFFDANVGWHKGWSWYSSLFSGALPDQICGEASTNYTRWPQVPGVPARISEYIPDVKLIYIMREPVNRAYSHYLHRYVKEVRPGEPFRESFEEFVEHDPMCLDSSDYLLQIQQYLLYFPRDAMHFLLLEDLQQHPAEVLERIFRFLELDSYPGALDKGKIQSNEALAFRQAKLRGHITAPLKQIPLVSALASLLPQSWRDAIFSVLQKTSFGERVKSNYEPKPMEPETRVSLTDRFASSNKSLSDLTELDLSRWLR